MIPYGRQSLDQSDIDSVVNVLRSDWLTCGPIVEQFEGQLKEITHAKYAVACSNGTTALHLALMSLGVRPGDNVLVPTNTFLASANAVRYVGANVTFVDVDPDTGLMTPETLEKTILTDPNRSYKAVINVHFAGQCEDLDSIAQIAQKYHLKIVEDASHAIGSSYIGTTGKSHPIGSNDFCDISTFSFHPVKTIAMGEGGAVTTNDETIAKKIKDFRSHSMIREPTQWKKSEQGPWYYEMHELGYNYRISDLNCALGLSQLKRLEEFKRKRSEIVKAYDKAFANLENIKPLKKLSCSDTAWHLYILLCDFEALGTTRTNAMKYLKDKGIGTQVHYIPVHTQPYYEKLYGKQSLPGAEKYYARCLSLPLFVGLSKNEQEQIIETVSQYVG